MISDDKEREFDKTLSYLEYHASFTNHEGVKKAKEFRKEQKEDTVKEAEEFILSSEKENAFNSINLNKLIKEDI